MSINELMHMVGADWGLIALTIILLYMFIRRQIRVGGLLAITGIIATTLLLALLSWKGWTQYSTANSIVEIVNSEATGYTLFTVDGVEIKTPMILELNDIRYVIDTSMEKQVRYFPWNVVALPK